MSGARKISEGLFAAMAEDRFGPNPRNWKVVCPMCGTAQSPSDLLATGKFEPGTGQVNKVFGYSCIGRFTGQGDEGIAAKNRGEKWDKGCNWTLGGLLQCHEVEIVCEDGSTYPFFDLAPAPDLLTERGWTLSFIRDEEGYGYDLHDRAGELLSGSFINGYCTDDEFEAAKESYRKHCIALAASKCPNDTDGDGDCHLCATTGGCKFKGGPGQ